MEVKSLVISGYGINCEKEMASACEIAGGKADIVHAQKLLLGQVDLNTYHFLCLPGGFSFGDELGAAKVFANRLKQSPLISQLKKFVNEGKCILGICNGFQLLVKLGLLPGFSEKQAVSLTHNDSGRFDNRWIDHKTGSKKCVFTAGVETLSLPIRHGEGKFVACDNATLSELKRSDQIAFQYSGSNPNGSAESIAGICDATGRVLGMMAHPEAALYFTNHPNWIREKEAAKRAEKALPVYGDGYKLFKNAINFLRNSV